MPNAAKTDELEGLRRILEKYDRSMALACAVVAAAVWFYSQPIVFTNDSFGYLSSAKFIVGQVSHGVPYYRMPLFPLWLVVTGVPTLGTFKWFILAQSMLGILMVMIFHDGLRDYSRPAGLIATAVFTLTFVPFVYSKSVMTEQLYLFGLILCLASTLGYLRAATTWRLALVALGVAVTLFTRVQGIGIGLVVLPFLIFRHPRHWRAIAAAACAVLIAVAAYSVVYSAQVRKHSMMRADAAGAEPALSNAVGKYLFMVPYLDAYRYFGWRIVTPSNGPGSAKLFTLVDDGEKQPTLTQWWAIWQTLDGKIGVASANDLLLRVTIEAVIAHPWKAAALYGYNLIAATYRLNSSYVWEHPRVTIDDESLNREFVQSGDQSSVTLLAKVVNPLFHAALIAATILVIATAGAQGLAWGFCVALYAYNLATIAVSGAPEGRIVFYGLPLLLAALATARSKGLAAAMGSPAGWINPHRRPFRQEPSSRWGTASNGRWNRAASSPQRLFRRLSRLTARVAGRR